MQNGTVLLDDTRRPEIKTRVPHMVACSKQQQSDFRVQWFWDAWTPQDWNNPWLSPTVLLCMRVFYQIESKLSKLQGQDAKSIIDFISHARNNFENVCTSLLAFFYFCPTVFIIEEMLQLRTEETDISFLFFFCLLLSWFTKYMCTILIK